MSKIAESTAAQAGKLAYQLYFKQNESSEDWKSAHSPTVRDLAISAAEQGDSKGQLTVAQMIWDGVICPKEDETVSELKSRAVKLIQLAAAQNDPEGLYQLSLLYNTGAQISKNEAMARKVFEKAACLGHVKARDELIKMCLTGKGGPKDTLKAGYWLIEDGKDEYGSGYLPAILRAQKILKGTIFLKETEDANNGILNLHLSRREVPRDPNAQV